MYSKLRKVSSRAFAVPILAAALAFSGTGAAPPAAAAGAAGDGVYQIVAVGDSLTAGYQFGFTEQSVPYGYVERVYEQALFHGLRAEYVNYGVLGLKSPGLTRWIEAVSQEKSIPADEVQAGLIDPRADRIFADTPKLSAALTKADLIVMTIGGNDLKAVITVLDRERAATEAELAAAAALLETSLSEYEKELEAALKLLAKLQPDAEIVVADQYLPVPSPLIIKDSPVELYPETNRQFLLGAQKQLQIRLGALVARLVQDGIDVKVANVAKPFTGNELAYTSVAREDIHPNALGYAAMGKAFSETIWNEYLTVKPRDKNVPISVVVNGKELVGSYKPVLIQNRTFVPLREITEALGATVKWNSKTQTATIEQEGRTVAITIGATSLTVNGIKTKLNAQPAFLHKVGKESKTYLPLAALSEGLAFQVVYRDTLKAAFINK